MFVLTLILLLLKMCCVELYNKTEWSFLVHMTCGRNECFGILIAPRWVLTSASCFYTGYCTEVNIGDINNSNLTIRVSGSIKYPNYEELPNTIHDSFPTNDIAMIRLETEVNDTKLLNLSHNVPDRNLMCKYLVVRKESLAEVKTNNFLSCRDIKELFNIPDVPPQKIKNICNKLCVTTHYVRSEVSKWGGPLICGNELQGIYSDTIRHESQKKTAWTMPFAYIEWINAVMEFNQVFPPDYDPDEKGHSKKPTANGILFIFIFCILLFNKTFQFYGFFRTQVPILSN